MENKREIIMVASLNFEINNCWYAFSLVDNPLEIHSNPVWNKGSSKMMSLKAPTCLLLDKNKDLVAFGYDAEYRYEDLRLGGLTDDYYFFCGFTTLLYSNKNVTGDIIIKDVTGKILPAFDVFKFAVKYFVSHFIDALETRGTGVTLDEVKWVLTVPSSLPGNAKDIMKSSAAWAGIKLDHLVLVPISVSAFVYCQTRLLLDNKQNSQDEAKYMVVDLGEFATDITVFKSEHDQIIENYHITGDDSADTLVHKQFFEVLDEIVGESVIKLVREKDPLGYLDFTREFDIIKRIVNNTTKEKINMILSIVSLNKVCREIHNSDFQSLIQMSKYARKIHLLGDALRFDADIVRNMFKSTIDNVMSLMEKIFIEYKDLHKVTHIFMVGGFSECILAQDAVKQRFPSKHIIIMENASNAAGMGAVLCGHKPRQYIKCPSHEIVKSKQAEDAKPTTFGQMQYTPTVEDDIVPIEIKLMSNKKSIPLYLKLLESGSEKKRDIRLVIVGKKGTGKTSLCKRLFEEEVSKGEVKSTNGIEIHRIKCNANYDDGIWNKLNANNQETERNARLLKPYEETLVGQGKGTNKAAVTMSVEAKDSKTVMKASATSLGESDETASQQYEKPKPHLIANCDIKSHVSSEPHVEPSDATKVIVKSSFTTEPLVIPFDTTIYHKHQPNLSLEQAYAEVENMLKSEVNIHDKEEYATLLLWDFAGDEEFYHTHQTFMSPNAIYLVVAKLNEAYDKDAQDLFRLWMDSIHCYGRIEEEKNKYDDNMRLLDDLDPSVVVIGTWKDACTSESADAYMIEDACREHLLAYTRNMADDERGHIKAEVFISNTEDDNIVFQKIRQDILKLAKTNRTWNKEYPLKFIQMEKRLQEKKKELPIVAFHELKLISTETPMPLNDEELILYLKFHHEIRDLVYFEDLPDYIILDTQWLSDAFKCIVTAKKFRSISIKNQKRWEEFHSTGKLYMEILEDIFKEQNILYKHKDHILDVMEKFDIIIRPIKPEEYFAIEKTCYYVPCMIKSEPACDIYKMLNVTKNTCKKSTWLCFKFRFLPPHLMNHLIASLCREYEVAEVSVIEHEDRRNTTQRVIALFRGTAVFELKKTTKLQKLLITTCPNFILVQILEFGKRLIIERGMYKHIAHFVTEEIKKIISTRFKMTNVNFEKKWDCGLTKPESVIGSHDFSAEEITEYYCGKCTSTHEFTDEWSDLQINTLCLSKTSQETTEANSKTETISENQTISTKVSLSFKGGLRAFSNVYEDSTGPSTCHSLKRFTKEEINYAKMGMILLNILIDVLYDLLKQDKTIHRLRSDCDITYLYKEHRRINKHEPSVGWGGTWLDIQSTNITIGDDIERIRNTRNELQHCKTFMLDDKRFNDLYDIIVDLLDRFDHHNKPSRLYTDQLNEIVAKTISAEELKAVENKIAEMTIEVEIQHLVNVTPQ